jgi:hypothetical protein
MDPRGPDIGDRYFLDRFSLELNPWNVCCPKVGCFTDPINVCKSCVFMTISIQLSNIFALNWMGLDLIQLL